jgi:membrane-associated protease RseP (regulator of RpoE activity)
MAALLFLFGLTSVRSELSVSGLLLSPVAAVYFLAGFSLALAIFNLLPIPPLDGGQIALLVFEKLRGKRLSVGARKRLRLGGIIFLLLVSIGAACGLLCLEYDQEIGFVSGYYRVK